LRTLIWINLGFLTSQPSATYLYKIALMQTLRHAHYLARFVLVWFVLSIGVAVASPLVAPKSMELVCTTAGATKLVAQGEGDNQASNHLLDCPLCAVTGAPPAQVSTVLTQPSPLSHALHPIEAARIASATAPPLPSRGPPSTSC
jgi:hypothetical protein